MQALFWPMPFCLTRKHVCGMLQRMRIFTRKLKFFCATFILGILLAWLIAFPLHLALQELSHTDRLSDRKADCHSCCSHHLDNHNTDLPVIKNTGHDTGFCSLCDLASQFFTSGLARISVVASSGSSSTVVGLLTSIYSKEFISTGLPRAPPTLFS